MKGYRSIEQVEGYLLGRIKGLEKLDNSSSDIEKSILFEVLYFLQGNDDNC